MNQSKFSHVMPIWKFCTLYIFTWGIYQLPWAHKQWKFIKEREHLNIRPWVRSWLLPFYLYSLCQKVFALAEEQGYRVKASAFQVTLFYWIFIALGQLPDPLWVIALFTFVPLLSVVKALNYYWGQQQENLPINESFTGREIAWILFGVVFWLLIIIGFLSEGNI